MNATICNGCERVTNPEDALTWINVNLNGDSLHYCTTECLAGKIERDGSLGAIRRPAIFGRPSMPSIG